MQYFKSIEKNIPFGCAESGKLPNDQVWKSKAVEETDFWISDRL